MAKKILLVDDEPDFLSFMTTRLESNGYKVITADNGVDCVMKAKSERPDLILLDIMLPKKDGYTAFKELKAFDATGAIPVIVVTAKPYLKDLFAIEGLKDYVVKPFDDKALLDKIKKHIG